MATNHSSKRPATTLRCGSIKAMIWQNVSQKGTSECRLGWKAYDLNKA